MGLSLERTTSGNERDTAGQVTVLVRAPYLAEEFDFPALITRADPRTRKRFLVPLLNICNPNTRAAYGRAAGAFLALVRRTGASPALRTCSPCTWRPTSSNCRGNGRLPPSSSTWPRSACCLTGS